MKLKFWVPAFSSVLLFTALVFCGNKNFVAGDSLLEMITTVLKQGHYEPPKIDDAFSKKVYTNVLEKIDNEKRFFTKEDLKKLSKYEKLVDDQIKAGSYEFFDTVWHMMMRRLDLIEAHNKGVLATPFSYNGNDVYTVKDEATLNPKDIAELKREWNGWLKFQSLDRLYKKMEQQKTRSTQPDSVKKDIKILPYDSLELKSRTETSKFVSDWFRRWRKMDRRDQISFYVNSITEVYDPHTNYFPPEDKANFDISMTGKLEGIGATLSEKDGYIKIERIVPGSASYRQGDLKAGDLIIKVAQGNGEPVDVVDMKLDDAIQLIRGKKGTEVRLTVKKPDGSIKVVPIIRDVVVIEESYARSAIVEHGGKKMGVIYLPSFYADFNSRGRGRHSSEDVRNEITKLLAEGAQGIILDLRNNGGGSLADAIDMGGLFIPTGPIVQVRNGNDRIQTGDDPDPSVAYNGPLAILTNTYSASASEILAAALQDYKRAVIIGSKSTFGKGTVQTFLPLEGEKSTDFPMGYGQVKVTIQKFYRINGLTTQLQGVVPDVILPDMYDQIEQGEKEMDFHMPFDKIDAAKYDVFNAGMSPRMNAAISNAKARVAESKYFQSVSKQAVALKQFRTSYTYSLNLNKFTEQQKQLKAEEKKFTDDPYVQLVTGLKPLSRDMSDAAGDTIKEAQRKDWLKMYAKDPGLDQAVLSLLDMF